MKRFINWTILPTALAATLTTATFVMAQTIQTPLPSTVTVTGSSGGGQQSQCGFIPGSPSQVINVQAPTPLRFKLQAQGQPTLWITGPVNRCGMSDNYSGGNIEVPGVWQPGTYQVFVGDLNQGSHPYTLSIIPEN